MPDGVVVSLLRPRAPEAGIGQPFVLLDACHTRERDSLDALSRLINRLQAVGHDAAARRAAHDVWRCFETAAAHHADEERHVLPRLRQSGDLWLADVARRLHAEHEALHDLWQPLGPLLREVHESASALSARALDALRGLSARFIDIQQRHLRLEDSFAFPAVRERLRPDDIEDMARAMRDCIPAA